MTTVNLQQTSNELSEKLEAVRRDGERVMVSQNGEPVAALISVDDLEILRQLEDARDLELARQARAEGGPAIPIEQVKAEFGID